MSLLILLIITGISRWQIFSRDHTLTFDEVLYAQMAKRVLDNPLSYNSQFKYQEHLQEDKRLMEYLNYPLYKHPPLFTYTISGFFIIFNLFNAVPSYSIAALVSILSGVVIVLMTYLTASYLFNRQTGLLSAMLVSFDPVNWLSAQKIWPAATLAALMWAALYFIIKAIKENKVKYFLLAGLFSGLALLTKYPAVALFPIGITMAFFYDKKIILTRKFWLWPLFSFIIFSPWVIWNYNVYGAEVVSVMLTAQGEMGSYFFSRFLFFSAAFVFFAAVVYVSSKKYLRHFKFDYLQYKRAIKLLLYLALVSFFLEPYMRTGVVHMLNLNYAPPVGWYVGMFIDQPWSFYFRRLIELSPYYFISFFGIIFLANSKNKLWWLYVASFWILALFIVLRNYQSRYILAATPALLIAAARIILTLHEKIEDLKLKNPPKYRLYITLFLLAVIYCFMKVMNIHLYLSVPNNMAYF